ncbi:hypothetical protein [Streptomyces sp. HB2AG]|uniref:hypothetical protein n=1 Tax=Streptomyces sp. HB2AG TaxID=2983400 RepID=UPI0022AA1371|nr:hypothetical protein [Streptomyces sp. HB2AG]MCZ2527686.1 hypothetical protein [Streptomyces sp. HB2AG]
MTTGSTDSPASLYGPVSLVLGTVALATAVFAAYVGFAIPLLCGSLAATFGVLGLTARTRRVQCAVGLTTGGLAVLYFVALMVAFSG